MKRRIHLKSQPIYVKKLIDIVGVDKASSELGVTPWAVKRHINKNQTSQAIEIAAQYIWEKTTARTDEKSAIVRGDDDLMQMIQRMVKIGNGNYTTIN